VPGANAGAPRWLLGPFGDGLGLDGPAFLALLAFAFLTYLVVTARATAYGRRALTVGIAAAIALFALAPPLLSLDVFSYISYGRLQLEGMNPYESAPADLPGDEAARRVEDYRGAVSVYGPLFSAASAPLAALGVPAALWLLKALAALAALALVLLVGRLAAARGLEPKRALALVGLNPILLVHGVGGAHNDVFVALAVVGAVALALGAREALAGAALALGAAVKAVGALPLPFALAGAGGPRGRAAAAARLAAGAAATALVLGAGALALYGPAALESLGVLGRSQDTVSYWSVPALISRAGLEIDLVRAVLAGACALALLGLLRWCWRGGDWVRAAGWATLAVLAASAYLTPWYVLWALPLAALSRDRALVAATLVFTAFQLRPSIPL
jgi:hypothetical protein